MRRSLCSTKVRHYKCVISVQMAAPRDHNIQSNPALPGSEDGYPHNLLTVTASLPYCHLV
jgi:hypothetical protein